MIRRKLLALCVALLVCSLLICLASPGLVFAGRSRVGSTGPEKWAVILSPGPQTGVPWGGYHVTITGYDEANGGHHKAEALKRAFKTLFHGKPWHLHGDLPELEKWKGTWTQTFESHILNDLAERLRAEGFDRVKGPKYAHTRWHISLHGDHNASKMKVNTFKQGKTDWYLWQVPEPGSRCKEQGIGCPRWKQID